MHLEKDANAPKKIVSTRRWQHCRAVALSVSGCLLASFLVDPRALSGASVRLEGQRYETTMSVPRSAQPFGQNVDRHGSPSESQTLETQISNLDPSLASRERMAEAVNIYQNILGLSNPELIAGLPRGLRNVILKSVEAASKFQGTMTNPQAVWQAHGRHDVRKAQMWLSQPVPNQEINDVMPAEVPTKSNAEPYLSQPLYRPTRQPNFDSNTPSMAQDYPNEIIAGPRSSVIFPQRPKALKRTSLGFFREHPRTDTELFKHDLAVIILLVLALMLVCLVLSVIRCFRQIHRKRSLQSDKAQTQKIPDVNISDEPTLLTLTDPVKIMTESLAQVAAEIIGVQASAEPAVDVVISAVLADPTHAASGGDAANKARLEAARALRTWLREQGYSAAICRRSGAGGQSLGESAHEDGEQSTPAAVSQQDERVLHARLVVILADNAWVRSPACVRLLCLALGANQAHARPNVYVLCSKDFSFRDGLAVGDFRLGPGNSSVLEGPAGWPAAWEALRPHLPRVSAASPASAADTVASAGGLSPEGVAAARAAADEIERRLAAQLRPLLEMSPRSTLLSAPGAVMAPTFLRPTIKFDYTGGYSDRRR